MPPLAEEPTLAKFTPNVILMYRKHTLLLCSVYVLNYVSGLSPHANLT